MTIPQPPEDPQSDVPVSEVPDPVKATAPKAKPAPGEGDEAGDEETGAPVAMPATTTPVPPVPPLGSGH